MRSRLRPTLPALVLVLAVSGLAASPNPAIAHGEMGDHVETFEQHLDDYTADVESMSDTLVHLREAQHAGDAASLEPFLSRWHEAEYHEAVETVTTPLYPPIWAAISGVREALAQDSVDPAVLNERVATLQAALWEGLGALKLAAHEVRSGERTAAPTATDETGARAAMTSEDPKAALDRIRMHLEQAVSAFEQGDPKTAKARIRDAYYHHFEGLEGDLIPKDPELVVDLEEDFNAHLPALINRGASSAELNEAMTAVEDRLEAAQALLTEGDESTTTVF